MQPHPGYRYAPGSHLLSEDLASAKRLPVPVHRDPETDAVGVDEVA